MPARVCLVGNPNVGKSVIFGALSGRYATVSNYPGTTVEVTRGVLRIPQGAAQLIDTPGTNGIVPQSEDECVTRDILLEAAATVLQVADEKNLSRALALTLQIAETGLPLVLCLNMSDEARELGIRIDRGKLSERIGVEATATVATRRTGLRRLPAMIAGARPSRWRIDYGPRIEEALLRIEPLLPDSHLAPRSLALAVLSGDESLAGWLRNRLAPERLDALLRAAGVASGTNGHSMANEIQRRRIEAADRLAAEVTVSGVVRPAPLRSRLGALSMRPSSGLLIAAAVLFAIYEFVGVFGAQIGVEWMEERVFGSRAGSVELVLDANGVAEVPLPAKGDNDPVLSAEIREQSNGARELVISLPPDVGDDSRLDLVVTSVPHGAVAGQPRREGPGSWSLLLDGDSTAQIRAEAWSGWINPHLRAFLLARSPSPLATDLLTGRYGLITMGLTYAVAIVLPIVITFFLAFAVLEDSGYLPRLAVMLNRLFRVMGLNGRAVLPMVLGLGCDTMATLTTRILPTRKERQIVILLLALGVPCSAQLGVILGMLAALSWKASIVWAGVVALVIVMVGFLASRVIPGPRSEFIMEIPPIRWPSPGNLVRKTLARVEWYLKEAVPLFLIGTLILFIADRTVLLDLARRGAEPVVTNLLGLPAATADAFIIGFLRRDFGAAGLYRLAASGALDPVQIVVSLVTMTLFIPCIANFLVIVKEQGPRVALQVAAFIFPFAVLVGGLLMFTLRHLGLDLA